MAVLLHRALAARPASAEGPFEGELAWVRSLSEVAAARRLWAQRSLLPRQA